MMCCVDWLQTAGRAHNTQALRACR